MNKTKDTIFAIATPTGKSAIAIIRISGLMALEVIEKISSKSLTSYIENMFEECPNHIFENVIFPIEFLIKSIFKKF